MTTWNYHLPWLHHYLQLSTESQSWWVWISTMLFVSDSDTEMHLFVSEVSVTHSYVCHWSHNTEHWSIDCSHDATMKYRWLCALTDKQNYKLPYESDTILPCHHFLHILHLQFTRTLILWDKKLSENLFKSKVEHFIFCAFKHQWQNKLHLKYVNM